MTHRSTARNRPARGRRGGAARVAAGLACIGALAAGAAGLAQDGARFGGRLSVLPVDFATRPTMSGSGRAEGVLAGRTLTVAGAFEGLSSPAVAARLHRAPPARRGPAEFALDVTRAEAGRFAGEIALDDDQVPALRRGEYYVQVGTRNNPDGEIRGWLAPRAETADASTPAGFPVRELLGYVRAVMPPAGRRLDEAALAAVVACILQRNGAEAGTAALSAASEGRIVP